MKKNQKRPKQKTFKWLVGIDEVGRGPLAGPVAVCAVAVPFDDFRKNSASLAKLFRNESRALGLSLTDSKKLSEQSRNQWYAILKKGSDAAQIQYALSYATAIQIDTKGIAVCIKSLVKKNLTLLQSKINFSYDDVLVLLDGSLYAPSEYLHQETIIKGDEKEPIISYASIIAKVSRDKHMTNLSKKYPAYAFHAHKGYGTKAHISAIRTHGPSKEHRMSFLKSIL